MYLGELKKKNVIENNANIIRVGYCELYYLLKGIERIGYTSGAYGWNADVYEANNVVIVTGYRPFGNIRPSYELTSEYNEKAKKLCKEPCRDTDALNTKINKLLNDFIKKALEEDGE